MKIKTTILFYLMGLFSAVLLLSCKKPKKAVDDSVPPVNTAQTNGMPADLKNINGYLYASNKSTYYATSFNYAFYAAFSDPGRKLQAGWDHFNDNNMGFSNLDLFGNIDVGSLVFNNGITLQKTNVNPGMFYSAGTNNLAQPLTGAGWTNDGNHSFLPLNVSVSRGFPVIAYTATFSAVSKTSGYTIDISQYLSNYDSVTVNLSDNTSWQNNIKKRADANTQIITFTQPELINFYSGASGSIFIYGYNYSTQVINDKVYLYELSTKIQRTIMINP